jgi:hypothetical protein
MATDVVKEEQLCSLGDEVLDEATGELIRKAPLTGEVSKGLLYQRRNKISTWRKLSCKLVIPKSYGASQSYKRSIAVQILH